MNYKEKIKECEEDLERSKYTSRMLLFFFIILLLMSVSYITYIKRDLSYERDLNNDLCETTNNLVDITNKLQEQLIDCSSNCYGIHLEFIKLNKLSFCKNE